MVCIIVNFFAALNYLGVPTEFDQGEGITAGAAFVPTDLDPNNQTRSDARRTYFDPYATRQNFQVFTGQHVTQLLIEGIVENFGAGNPTSGGNDSGDGGAGGNTGGLNFGPGDEPPPVSSRTSGRFARRFPNDSNLRVVGVEVSGIFVSFISHSSTLSVCS